MTKENEVDENNSVHFLHVNNAKKTVPFYFLDVIISVGYRVKSKRDVEFRRWANSVLKQYILQGYAVNQRRIHQLLFFVSNSRLEIRISGKIQLY